MNARGTVYFHGAQTQLSFNCQKSQYTTIIDTLGKHIRFDLNKDENAGILQSVVPSNFEIFQEVYKDLKNILFDYKVYKEWKKDKKGDASKPLLDEEHGTDKAIQNPIGTPAAS